MLATTLACLPRRAPSLLRNLSASSVSIAPGIPADPSEVSTQFWNIRIPNLSVPPPQPTAQIPYEPDFWDSYTKKTAPEAPLPKLLLVAGEETNHGIGLAEETHDLLGPTIDITSLSETLSESIKGNTKPNDTFVADVLEDLGLLGVKFKWLPGSKDRS